MLSNNNTYLRTHNLIKFEPCRNTSANFNKAEFIRIGNGYLVNKLGKRTIASA